MPRFRPRCAALLILTKTEGNKEYVLLQHRQNTGILDNMWGVSVNGHLEKGETIKECIIREALEEINIKLRPEDLKLVNLTHANFNGVEYIMPIFHTNKYQGKIKICEPEKCDKLEWFDINDLPHDIAQNRKQMIENYLKGNNYQEIGFEKEKI